MIQFRLISKECFSILAKPRSFNVKNPGKPYTRFTDMSHILLFSILLFFYMNGAINGSTYIVRTYNKRRYDSLVCTMYRTPWYGKVSCGQICHAFKECYYFTNVGRYMLFYSFISLGFVSILQGLVTFAWAMDTLPFCFGPEGSPDK